VRIDREHPTCSISYDPAHSTNGDVVATLTGCNEAITVITGYLSSLSGEVARSAGGVVATFTSNGTFIFEYIDHVGNTGSTTATVDRIDKSAL